MISGHNYIEYYYKKIPKIHIAYYISYFILYDVIYLCMDCTKRLHAKCTQYKIVFGLPILNYELIVFVWVSFCVSCVFFFQLCQSVYTSSNSFFFFISFVGSVLSPHSVQYFHVHDIVSFCSGFCCFVLLQNKIQKATKITKKNKTK